MTLVPLILGNHSQLCKQDSIQGFRGGRLQLTLCALTCEFQTLDTGVVYLQQ